MEDLLKQIEAISKPFSPLLLSGGRRRGGGVGTCETYIPHNTSKKS